MIQRREKESIDLRRKENKKGKKEKRENRKERKVKGNFETINEINIIYYD